LGHVTDSSTASPVNLFVDIVRTENIRFAFLLFIYFEKIMSDDSVNNLAEKYQSLRNSNNATDEKYQVMKVSYIYI
jgi:hypothetical protein